MCRRARPLPADQPGAVDIVVDGGDAAFRTSVWRAARGANTVR
jgi:hypothetical protein